MDNNILGECNTGYIRLSYSQLQDIRLIHLVSGVDENEPGAFTDGAVPTAITGYTEWVGAGSPVVSIGWDWQMLADHSQVQLTRVGGASSNIMLQSASHTDLGHTKTALLLETLIDSLFWQPATLEYVSVRYKN
jgi:hypothetical protein